MRTLHVPRPHQLTSSSSARRALRGLGGKALVVGAVGAIATAAPAPSSTPQRVLRRLPRRLAALVHGGVGLPRAPPAAAPLGRRLGYRAAARRWRPRARTIPFVGARWRFRCCSGSTSSSSGPTRPRSRPTTLLQHKALYLNLTVLHRPLRFADRALLVLRLLPLGQSAAQDEHGDGGRRPRGCSRSSAVGLLLFVIATSFVGFDWLMSLDPHWFSSLYGAIFLAGERASRR